MKKVSEPAEFQRIVMHAFGLHPMFRSVFLLCDIRGFTIGETATILGISHAAVIRRLRRARHEVNTRLKDGHRPS
jgi:DNA-directed RNA polymerase specialized sigma24 family protein